ncbi:MAG: FHA domain-containing protein, partial [Desulfobacterales bacterium]|nr:FHA domain-containing protein [Desulfobacterales bacterium]
YLREIEKRIGIIKKICLSIIGWYNYLVFVSDKIIIGNRNSNDADLKIQATGISSIHGEFVRDKNEFYFVPKSGNSYISGEIVKNRIRLDTGYNIKIGNTFVFTVEYLHGDAMVLSMNNNSSINRDIYRIIMMGTSFDIGTVNCHINYPRCKDKYKVFYKDKRFSIKDPSNKIIDFMIDDVHKIGDIEVQVTRGS